MTLPQGLIRSCNPFFWHIGLDLYNRDLTTAVAQMARGFGLGKPTGIVGLDEAAGSNSGSEQTGRCGKHGDRTGQRHGHSATGCQVRGSHRKWRQALPPQLVERISSPDGKLSEQFKPQLQGKLPLSPENLQTIQQAMVGVIRNEKPRGTAWHVFTGLDVPVAGKTGTAQSGSDLPHAWFAGYTFAEREGQARYCRRGAG